MSFEVRATQGEAGTSGDDAVFDLDLNYDTLVNLIAKLAERNLRQGQVTRLTIDCQGGPGELQIEGHTLEFLDNDTLPGFRARIEEIRDYLADGCSVSFRGCFMAEGDRGSSLLCRLSENVYFRGCWVTGFVETGEHDVVNASSYRKTAYGGRIVYDSSADEVELTAAEEPDLAPVVYRVPPERHPRRPVNPPNPPEHPYQGQGQFRRAGPLGS